MIDLEISLARAFHWSLYDIDRTNIESLIPFYLRVARSDYGEKDGSTVYCDEVDWL